MGKKIKQKSPLQFKREREELLQANVLKALQAANRRPPQHKTVGSKRRPNDELRKYIAIGLDSGHAVRCASGYKAKSYNLSTQVLALIDHVFVQYKVPQFLYRSVLTHDGLALVFGQPEVQGPKSDRKPKDWAYRDWFLAAAQGRSVARLAAKELTKRETHLLLQAPDCNTIQANMLWAKAAAAGVPHPARQYLVDRLEGATLRRVGDRLPDVLRFYASAWNDLRSTDRDEVTDFLLAALQDRGFSLKGRTLTSIRKLSREWHRRTYRMASIGTYVSWHGSLTPWEYREKRLCVRALELTNNRELAEEGAKQQHCVFTYAGSCLRGASRIVSIRWFAIAGEKDEPTLEMERLTLEVAPHAGQVVQIRGFRNRQATDEEMKIVRRWSGEQGLRIWS